MNSNNETEKREGLEEQNLSEKDHDPCHRRHWGGKRKLLIGPFILVAILVKGLIVLKLWNALIPDLFHGPEVTYIQAIGLMILAKIFVGFGFHRHHHGHRGHHDHGGRHGHGFGRFERGFVRRFAGMSDEQREKLKADIDRWCRK